MVPTLRGSQPAVNTNRSISWNVQRIDWPSRFAGQQLLYVLNGEGEFVISGGQRPARELFRPGDSVYFHTEYPHQISGVSRSPFATHAAEAIAVFWSPVGDPGLMPAGDAGSVRIG